MDFVYAMMAVGRWPEHHALVVVGALLLSALVVGGVAVGRWRRAAHRPGAHGSARWASLREVRQAGLWGPGGVVLGRIGRHVLRSNDESHILLLGATRSGKGVGCVIPTLLTWRESVLILDPKDGELYDVTSTRRQEIGPVVAFTPCRGPQARINVLDTVRLGTPHDVGDAQLIAQSLVAPAKLTGEGATAVHFRELASLLLTAGILHVSLAFPRRSLAGVWDFLTQQHTSLAAALQTMARTAHPAIHSMVRAVQNISGDRELSGVWTTAIRPLVLYSDPLVAASTDTSTFPLEALQHHAAPVSLYLVAPSPMQLDRLHPLYRVILDVAWTRLMERKVRTWTWRLLNCCDELPWYGYSRVIDKGIATMAGYGIKSLLVTQDFDALYDVYGQHSAIFGNCAVQVYQTVANDLTAKRISENLLGRSTVESPGTSRSRWGGRTTDSVHQVSRPLLTTEEVLGLSAHEEIVHVVGARPIRARKLDYRRDRC